MSANHDAIKTAFETYVTENEKFTAKGVKAAAARARKALQEMSKAIIITSRHPQIKKRITKHPPICSHYWSWG